MISWWFKLECRLGFCGNQNSYKLAKLNGFVNPSKYEIIVLFACILSSGDLTEDIPRGYTTILFVVYQIMCSFLRKSFNLNFSWPVTLEMVSFNLEMVFFLLVTFCVFWSFYFLHLQVTWNVLCDLARLFTDPNLDELLGLKAWLDLFWILMSLNQMDSKWRLNS